MEEVLQQVADGRAKGLKRWYGLAHAARCFRCGNFLQRLSLTLEALQASRQTEPDEEALARLRARVRKLSKDDEVESS
jgi:hypothetical protein